MRALVLCLVLAAAPMAGAQDGPRPGGPHVIVTGEGRVARAPDMAMVGIGVEAQASEPGAATDALAARIGPVMDALGEAGVASEDIRTGTLELHAVYRGEHGGPQEGREIAGYRAESLLTVTLRRTGEIGRVVGAAIAAGANRLDGIGFALSDPRAAEDAALEEAAADARRKAALLAKAAGRPLGPVLSIVESGGGGMPSPMRMQMEARASVSDVPVAPGEIDVTASLRMTFGLGAP